MEEMMRFYNMGGEGIPTESTLIVNDASPLITKLGELTESAPEKAEAVASYVYKVSLLSQKKFSAEEMQSFMKDSYDLLMML